MFLSNLYLNLNLRFMKLEKSFGVPKENVFFDTKNAFSLDT